MGYPRYDPSALRFLIGHDLRTTRERAGIKQGDAAKHLKCAQSKMNSIETGKFHQRQDEVAALLRFYGAEAEHVDRMASLAGHADQTVWWAPYEGAVPQWFRIFVGLEGLAVSAFSYKTLLLPGQLQTPAYATALLDGHLRVAPMDVPQVVRARMARQRLVDESPLRYRAVIEEYVLDRVVGSPQVMVEQLEHLLKLVKRKNVDIQIMPVGVTTHDGLDGEFVLLNFDLAQSIGYVEYPAGALYVQDPDQVELYKMASERLYANALSVAESAAVIQSRIEQLRK